MQSSPIDGKHLNKLIDNQILEQLLDDFEDKLNVLLGNLRDTVLTEDAANEVASASVEDPNGIGNWECRWDPAKERNRWYNATTGQWDGNC